MFDKIKIGNQSIPCFTLLIAIGVLIAIFIFFKTLKYRNINQDYCDSLFLLLPFIFIGAFLGAMIFDKIAHWGENGAKWYEPAGISFAGGLILGVILFAVGHLLVMKKGFKQMLKDAEMFIIPVLIAHAFGRIGCFCAGCCYGKPSDSFLAVTFPEGSVQHIQYGYITPVLPTQLFEAGFLFIMAFITFRFIIQYRLPIYLMSYGVFRFFLEYLRGDNRGQISKIFSPSQITSVVFIVSGIVILIYELKVKLFKKEQQSI